MNDPANTDVALHHLIEAVGDYAIYMLDPQGRVLTWNLGAERLKGYSAVEIHHQNFSRFFTPDDRRSGVPARLLAEAAAEGRVETEGWRVRKNGERFWALSTLSAIRGPDGGLMGFAKVSRDMTAQRAAQEALLESERQFRLLVSGVTDYALYMLDPNGIVTNWNAGAQAIKGYAADEIVGQHFSRFYTDADRAAGRPANALRTAMEAGRYEAEGWRVRKDGSLFWASVVIDVIRDESGALVGFAKITRDITERRDAQLEMQRAQEQINHAQRMEALGQLTGGVAHDFNNLLMVVSGQSQMLRKIVGDDPRAQRALDALTLAADRGKALTRHLLTFARRQRLEPRVMKLDERMNTLRELLQSGLPLGVTLEIDIPEGVWPVQVDPSEFELAVLNLTVNARDAMPGGGTLSIGAQNVRSTGADAPGIKGDFVAITVSDTGSGIPPDILPRIFDPFFTTKEVSKGTGLGLSQVLGFAQQSGGQATVTSEFGKGATVTLYLPRADPNAPISALEADTDETAVAPRADILLVEDNPDVADVASGLLEQLGHRVRIASSAAAALAALGEGWVPDLVFSDIVMAGELDGIGLARRLRTELPQAPVLLATGYSQTAETLLDEFPILRKPYSLADLNRAVNAVLCAHGSEAVRAASTP